MTDRRTKSGTCWLRHRTRLRSTPTGQPGRPRPCGMGVPSTARCGDTPTTASDVTTAQISSTAALARSRSCTSARRRSGTAAAERSGSTEEAHSGLNNPSRSERSPEPYFTSTRTSTANAEPVPESGGGGPWCCCSTHVARGHADPGLAGPGVVRTYSRVGLPGPTGRRRGADPGHLPGRSAPERWDGPYHAIGGLRGLASLHLGGLN